ncbi:MAG: hypothetical protein J5582_10460 [Ruminococcus sp.]|uniref:hypothetical protein n=1 Tax=Ruminococcus sp. TaxID=41978 RepID=UPI0025E2922E|nr:hypothetical protein [Ruminococcus sp.]MBO4866962.1 hypothetical protein [Ruminococcus sp.]
MNGNDILRSMNGIDDRFVISAKRERIIKHSSNKKILQKVTIGIAAAVALAIPAGAIYTQFEHKGAVMEYFDEKTADYLEDNGLALNYVSENEHFRITVDTVLSDGNVGSMVLTVESLDSEDIDYIGEKPFFDMYITEKNDVSTGDKIFLEGGGSIHHDVVTDTQYSFQKDLYLCDIDVEKDYVMTFGLDRRDKKNDPELFDGISFDISFRPNVDVKEFEDEDGRHIYFSQIGFYTDEEETIRRLNHLSNTSEDIRLLRKNSILSDEINITSETYDRSSEKEKPKGCVWFSSIVEINDYNGARLGDMLFKEVK